MNGLFAAQFFFDYSPHEKNHEVETQRRWGPLKCCRATNPNRKFIIEEKKHKYGAQNGIKLYPTDWSPFLCLGGFQSLSSLCFADAPNVCYWSIHTFSANICPESHYKDTTVFFYQSMGFFRIPIIIPISVYPYIFFAHSSTSWRTAQTFGLSSSSQACSKRGLCSLIPRECNIKCILLWGASISLELLLHHF
jgi:hypothetical protein